MWYNKKQKKSKKVEIKNYNDNKARFGYVLFGT